MAMSTPFFRPNIRVILVSPLISKDEARIMGFEYASSIEEGLKLLKKAYTEAMLPYSPQAVSLSLLLNGNAEGSTQRHAYYYCPLTSKCDEGPMTFL